MTRGLTAPAGNAVEDLGQTVLTTRRRDGVEQEGDLTTTCDNQKPKLHAQVTLSPTLTCRGRGDFDFPSPQMTELFITKPRFLLFRLPLRGMNDCPLTTDT